MNLDRDMDGCLSREEVAGASLSVLPPTVLANVSADSMEDLFEMLDVDGGGTLTQAEFLEGWGDLGCTLRSRGWL